MDENNSHWTADSIDDYLYGMSSGFVRAIEAAMDGSVTQSQLAERLGVSESRVSQMLNNPGNLTLRKIIEYARALHLNVAIVAYEEDDNKRGLVPPEIFEKCWTKLGKPRDFFDFESCTAVTDTRYTVLTVNSQKITGFIHLQDVKAPSVCVTTSTQPARGFIGYRATTGWEQLPWAQPLPHREIDESLNPIPESEDG